METDAHMNHIDSLADNAVTIVFYYVFKDVYHINCMLPVIRALSKKWYETAGEWTKNIEGTGAMIQWTDTDLKKQLNCAMQCGFEDLAFLPSLEKLKQVLIDDIADVSFKKSKRESTLLFDDNDSNSDSFDDVIRVSHQIPKLGIAWAAIVRNDTDLLSRSRAAIQLCPLQNVIISKWWCSEEPRINLYEMYSNLVSSFKRFKDHSIHSVKVIKNLQTTMKDAAARGEEGRMSMCYAQLEILDESSTGTFVFAAARPDLEKLIGRKEVLIDAGNAARERGETECLDFCTTEITKLIDRLEEIAKERTKPARNNPRNHHMYRVTPNFCF